jgi:tetratricopeptide (TPR) repeat protein
MHQKLTRIAGASVRNSSTNDWGVTPIAHSPAIRATYRLIFVLYCGILNAESLGSGHTFCSSNPLLYFWSSKVRGFIFSILLIFGLPLLSYACYWDRDTIETEIRSIEGQNVIDAMIGYFERYPPLYYEMRLARVTSQLESDTHDLAAFDDAGVACDRLERFDDAIAWMARKKMILDRLPADDSDAQTHRYRYHANLGTFIVHRWSKKGANRDAIGEVIEARNEIAKAIEINPDAHFGREKYQLMAMDWIISPPKMPESGDLPNILGWNKGDVGPEVDPSEARKAVEGLTGLIRLGNAWESVDVFNALNVAMQHNRAGFEPEFKHLQKPLAYFAYLRCIELIESGKGSMLDGAPQGKKLIASLPTVDGVDLDRLNGRYRELREEAEYRFKKSRSFVIETLEKGFHPDTHEDFWSRISYMAAPHRLSFITTHISKPIDERMVRSLGENPILWGIGTMMILLLLVKLSRRVCRGRGRQEIELSRE